jgi:hypothetical protein
MKRFLTLAGLVFAFLASAASAAPVELLKASSRTGGKYGYSWQDFSFDVRVDNLAYAKAISIVYRDSDGVWKEIPGRFSRVVDASSEVWQASLQRALNGPYASNPALDIQFAVKYVVGGQTHWDNNGGRNYVVRASTGEFITKNVLVEDAYASAPYSYNYGGNTGNVPGNFSVNIFLKNLAYAKNVQVKYTYDNWKTTLVGNASFQYSRFYGYSNVTYPNANGVEFWSFGTTGAPAQNTAATQVKFFVSYTVNGVTHLDNNFGKNYTVDIRKN